MGVPVGVDQGTSLTEAWVLHRGERHGQRRRFERGPYRLPEPGPGSVVVRPLYGSWEGNMDHAVRASPVDVCDLRGEPAVVLGNAGVVEVEAVGAEVASLRRGDVALVVCNGDDDEYGYPRTIFGYDMPCSVGLLAKRTVVSAQQLIRLPEDSRLTLRQWAAFSLRWITAWANWRIAWGAFRLQMPDLPPGEVHVWGWGGGVALAELALAAGHGCRAVMLTSRPERAAEIESYGIESLDRTSLSTQPEQSLLDEVRRRTGRRGVSIFVDNIGADHAATIKAVGRQGVIATSGWKHRTVFPISRPIECQNRRLHVFTHYASRRDSQDAVDWAESSGWAPRDQPDVVPWDGIGQLAEDFAAGSVKTFHPIFHVNDQLVRG